MNSVFTGGGDGSTAAFPYYIAVVQGHDPEEVAVAFEPRVPDQPSADGLVSDVTGLANIVIGDVEITHIGVGTVVLPGQSDGTVLLIVSGLGGTQGQWTDIQMQRGQRVVAPARRGRGAPALFGFVQDGWWVHIHGYAFTHALHPL